MFCDYYNYSWLMLLSKLKEKDSYNLKIIILMIIMKFY